MNRTIGGIKFENVAGNWVYKNGNKTTHLYATPRGWRICMYKTVGKGKYMNGEKLQKIIACHEALTARECVLRMFGGNNNAR